MQKILVTGGLGFIGSHTCVTLLQNEFDVVIVDNLSNSNKNVLEKIKFIVGKDKKEKIDFLEGDINDIYFLEKVFYQSLKQKHPITSVIHFAGRKSVAESVQYPLEYWNTNIGGSINLLKIMDKFNCRNFVFSSSATIYGDYGIIQIPESAEINPINPYGHTKYTLEKILNHLFLSQPKKWRIANLRYFNPVGAHPTGLIGENPKEYPNNLLPIILKVASGEQQLLKIYGNDWPTHDGTCIRDYIHVMDLAEGHIKALIKLKEGKSKIISLNLGTGVGTSVLELIKIFEKVNSCKIASEIVSRRNGDVASLVANSQKAKEYLKWIPKRSLEEVCSDSFKFHKLNA